jgi:hypothetical protein
LNGGENNSGLPGAFFGGRLIFDMTKEISSVAAQSEPPKGRRGPVLLAGMFLLLQGFFLFFLFPTQVVINFVQRPEAHLNMFFPTGGGFILPRVEMESLETLNILFRFPNATIPMPGPVVTGMLFLWLSAPVLLVGLVFLTGWRPAWVIAMLVQALLLVVALVIHFIYDPLYIYLVMATCIFIVFYLNRYDIQVAYSALRAKSEA